MSEFKKKIYNFNCHEITYILNFIDEHPELTKTDLNFCYGALFVHLKQLGYPVHDWKDYCLDVENDWLGKLIGVPTRKETFIEYILRLANEVKDLYAADN